MADSRTTTPSPRTSLERSPAYFMSWGSAPREAKGKIRQRSPISVSLSMKTWPMTSVPAPTRTRGPIRA
ncbi:MAG: hypothetical protein LBO05_08380 [Deltaproteobacteria bacterium]|nr:hypothetical protein [Deltaproteobacteria bacterium]